MIEMIQLDVRVFGGRVHPPTGQIASVPQTCLDNTGLGGVVGWRSRLIITRYIVRLSVKTLYF